LLASRIFAVSGASDWEVVALNMSIGDAVALLIGIALLVYLTWALLFPERM
jgi:K+-transporting ATPase KdpF subunit